MLSFPLERQSKEEPGPGSSAACAGMRFPKAASKPRDGEWVNLSGRASSGASVGMADNQGGTMRAEADELREARDLEWVRGALAGDSDSFRRLVEAYEGRVAGVVAGMLGEGADADDVGQEVFIRLHQSLGQFRGESRLSTWLTRIAINLCLDRLRARQRWHKRFLGLEEDEVRPQEPRLDGEALLDQRERARVVRRAVRRLRPSWRAVVVLRYLRGCSTEETAQALSIPYGTVLSRLSRGLSALRDDLGPLLGDEFGMNQEARA